MQWMTACDGRGSANAAWRGRKSEMWHLWMEAAWAAAALHKLTITSLVDNEPSRWHLEVVIECYLFVVDKAESHLCISFKYRTMWQVRHTRPTVVLRTQVDISTSNPGSLSPIMRRVPFGAHYSLPLRPASLAPHSPPHIFAISPYPALSASGV
jgi:hypothetical protein